MFGKNKVFNPKSYKDQPNDSLLVTSIFYTIQGEGLWSGRPAVFVRLTGCNLVCSFCDTYFDSGDTLTYEQIIGKILAAVGTYYMNNSAAVIPYNERQRLLIVITGGEPLNQPNLTRFLQICHEQGFDTQIESNGTIKRELPPETHLVISPKINERTNHYVKVNDELLQRANTLKFVASSTMPGYTDIPDWAVEWYHSYDPELPYRQRHMYISPMNMYAKQPMKLGENGTLEGRSEIDETISFWEPGLLDMKANQANHEHAAQLAMKYGCRLNLQMHLYCSLP